MYKQKERHIWHNIGLGRIKNYTVDSFNSRNFHRGIKIRRAIHPIVRSGFKAISVLPGKKKAIIESYPKLEKNKPYIFISSHSYTDDPRTSLVAIDRNAHMLFGTTDQLDHNPLVYGAWVNGMIYVNRLDPQNKSDSVPKMESVFKSGTSLIFFPEGGLNNTENLPCQDLFSGVYWLAKELGAEVVILSQFSEYGSKKAYINVEGPFDIASKDKKEAIRELRDTMGLMMIEHYEKHTSRVHRHNLYKETPNGMLSYDIELLKKKLLNPSLKNLLSQKIERHKFLWDEQNECWIEEPVSIPIATQTWQQIYEEIKDNATYSQDLIERVKQRALGVDVRMKFLEERKNEYLMEKWTRDVWDEELTVYHDKSKIIEEDVMINNDIVAIRNALILDPSLANDLTQRIELVWDEESNEWVEKEKPIKEKLWEEIYKVVEQNPNVLEPGLVRRLEKRSGKYDFKKYMHNNWNK